MWPIMKINSWVNYFTPRKAQIWWQCITRRSWLGRQTQRVRERQIETDTKINKNTEIEIANPTLPLDIPLLTGSNPLCPISPSPSPALISQLDRAGKKDGQKGHFSQVTTPNWAIPTAPGEDLIR